MQNHRWGRVFACLLLAASAVVCSSLALADTEKMYDYVSKVQVGEDSFVYFTVPGNPDALVHGTCGNQLWFRSPRPITDDRTKAILSSRSHRCSAKRERSCGSVAAPTAGTK